MTRNPNATPTRAVLPLAVLALLITGGILYAGPINPPAGPVGPTGKTLQEIFDKPSGGDGRIQIPGGTTSVAITQPGSYVLTGDIVTEFAMQIAASNVTLDLNGHHLISTVASSATLSIQGAQTNVKIRNGTVVGGVFGISVGTGAVGLLVEDVDVYGARANGITGANMRAGVLRRCRVFDTGSTTTATTGSTIVFGISISGTGNRVEGCAVSRLVHNNAGITPLFRGISMGGTGVVEGCLVNSDVAVSGTGIEAGSCVYRGNVVTSFSAPYSGGTDGGGNF